MLYNIIIQISYTNNNFTNNNKNIYTIYNYINNYYNILYTIIITQIYYIRHTYKNT